MANQNNSKPLDPPPTGKCLKTLRAINSVEADCKVFAERLKEVRKVLFDLMDQTTVLGKITKKDQDKALFKLQIEQMTENEFHHFPEILPPRLSFQVNGLLFYVDFLLNSDRLDGTINLTGVIVYGALRRECGGLHNTCKGRKFPRGHNVSWRRCDGLVDKPLLLLSVDDHGEITASGKFNGAWWIGEEPDIEMKMGLTEMHYQVIAEIWHDALTWTNEPFLP